MPEGLRGGVGARAMRARSAALAPAASASPASAARSTAPRLECRSSRPCAELGHLGDAAGDGDARHRMARADISACRRRNRPCRSAPSPAGRAAAAPPPPRSRRSRRRHGASPAARATSMPRWIECDPGGAGIRDHDPGGAQDRQAADDAEPAVQRALGAAPRRRGRRSRPRHRRPPSRRGDLGDRGADHLARHRIDGGLAGRQRQAGPRHGADARAGPEGDAAARARRAARVARTSAPWVTSGSSPASLTTPALAQPASRRVSASAKAARCAARQRDLDRVGKLAGRAAPRRPPWRRRWRRRRWSSRGAAVEPAWLSPRSWACL